MSTFVTIILILNLLFAGGIILLIMHGLFIKKRKSLPNDPNRLHL